MNHQMEIIHNTRKNNCVSTPLPSENVVNDDHQSKNFALSNISRPTKNTNKATKILTAMTTFHCCKLTKWMESQREKSSNTPKSLNGQIQFRRILF